MRILSPDLDTANATGKLMLNIFAAVAQFEREIMLERQREGIAKAKKENKYKGRKPISADKRAAIIRLNGLGAKKADIVKQVSLGVATVYRELAAHRAACKEAGNEPQGPTVPLALMRATCRRPPCRACPCANRAACARPWSPFMAFDDSTGAIDRVCHHHPESTWGNDWGDHSPQRLLEALRVDQERHAVDQLAREKYLARRARIAADATRRRSAPVEEKLQREQSRKERGAFGVLLAQAFTKAKARDKKR